MNVSATMINVLESAIAREMHSVYLYSEIARRMVNPEMKEFFDDLVAEEKRHQQQLELEYEKTGKTLPQIRIEKEQFALPDSFDISPKDALTLAIDKEDNSFADYMNLYSLVSDEASKELVLHLAEEEAIHKYKLQQRYEQIADED